MLELVACTTCDAQLRSLIFDESFLAMLGRVLAPGLAAGLIAAALYRME